MNGYVSLGLIHDALKAHDPVAYGALVAAQVTTVAALGRAAWLAFFRQRPGPFPERRPLRPGMVTALGTLGAGCVAFGVLPYVVLHRVAEPAAGGLLAAGPYAAGALSAGSRLPTANVSFGYFSSADLATALGTVAAGLLLCWFYVRHPEPRPVTWLRSLHNGSVNDYAAYLAAGGVVTIAVLLGGR